MLRPISAWFGWFGLTLAVLAGGAAACAAERPNVLMIAADDLNDWVGCLGGQPESRTPNIDGLARRGVLFARAYCAAPACNPSRTAVMTGLRPWTSGVYHNPQPWRPVLPDAVTLTQHFMNHGYEAVGCGKIFHGRFNDPKSWSHYERQPGDPRPAASVADDRHSRSGGIVWGALDVPDEQMNDYRVASYAIDYLSRTHDRPFFLACGLSRPHMPWQVPRKYYDMFPPGEITLPHVLESDLEDVPPPGVRMAGPQGDHATMLKTGNWRYAVQGYLASIAFADAQVGRLLDALDASPHADNTIVILWGDHGWHLGEKQHWRKFALWEEATRAPLIVAAPGVTPSGGVCPRTVDFTSVYPTLVELCGLPAREELDGSSLVPLLKDPTALWDRPAITTHGRGNHAVRSERYRYIRYADGSEELYDHETDPAEWKNLAGQPRLAEVRQQLAAWVPGEEAADAPREQEGNARRGRNRRRAE